MWHFCRNYCIFFCKFVRFLSMKESFSSIKNILFLILLTFSVNVSAETKPSCPSTLFIALHEGDIDVIRTSLEYSAIDLRDSIDSCREQFPQHMAHYPQGSTLVDVFIRNVAHYSDHREQIRWLLTERTQIKNTEQLPPCPSTLFATLHHPSLFTSFKKEGVNMISLLFEEYSVDLNSSIDGCRRQFPQYTYPPGSTLAHVHAYNYWSYLSQGDRMYIHGLFVRHGANLQVRDIFGQTPRGIMQRNSPTRD